MGQETVRAGGRRREEGTATGAEGRREAPVSRADEDGRSDGRTARRSAEGASASSARGETVATASSDTEAGRAAPADRAGAKARRARAAVLEARHAQGGRREPRDRRAPRGARGAKALPRGGRRRRRRDERRRRGDGAIGDRRSAARRRRSRNRRRRDVRSLLGAAGSLEGRADGAPAADAGPSLRARASTAADVAGARRHPARPRGAEQRSRGGHVHGRSPCAARRRGSALSAAAARAERDVRGRGGSRVRSAEAPVDRAAGDRGDRRRALGVAVARRRDHRDRCATSRCGSRKKRTTSSTRSVARTVCSRRASSARSSATSRTR